MVALRNITFRQATSADVPAMAQCRFADPAAGPVDPRMAAYLDGQHHPQQALAPRVGYVALSGEQVVAYIAGHQTRRHGCEGELQYLFVAPAYRRRGLRTALLRLLAAWFLEHGVHQVCAGIANDFDLATRDPNDPMKLRADFDSCDHLHPNDAGYRAMAAAVDLALLAAVR